MDQIDVPGLLSFIVTGFVLSVRKDRMDLL